MESLLCLGYPSKATFSPLCIPKGSHLPFKSYTISPSTICFNPLSVNSLRFMESLRTIDPTIIYCGWRPPLSANSLRFTISGLDKPERGSRDENVEKCKKTLQTTLKTSLVFLCAVGLVGASGFMKVTTPTAIAVEPDLENPCLTSLKNVKNVLETGQIDSDLDDYKIALHKVAIKRKGQKDIVEKLKDVYKVEKQKNLLDETEVEMALVEVLICLGEFEEASRCKCLNNPELMEEDEYEDDFMLLQHIHLYKAIVSAMLTKDEVKWEHNQKVVHIYGDIDEED